MAKVPLKITSQHAVIRCTGAAAHSITVASLASPRQTAPSSPKAAIMAIKFVVPTGATAKIERNGVLLYDFPVGWGTLDFNGYNDADQWDKDITVTITGTASVIIEFAKTSGWGDESHVNQNEVNG